ncbi:hypothetical protein PEBR_20394 [Penicillium brasilianum]|uniref:Subtilisin-like serine protease n=1 Tax=Penicillium brasilianum TaxID=104259 RepID=A0A1S9RPT9_PENBI|nr:hypothetical protein PEBR_20394 [Penicillium brasilianum]
MSQLAPQPAPQSMPFQTDLLQGSAKIPWIDMLPAYFRKLTVLVTINKDNVDEFLANELSLGKLEKLLEHLCYVSLISHESDYRIALESHLLPSELSVASWQDWKKFTREVIAFCNDETVHPRFLRAELRLSRLNILCRFTQAPLFEPYLRQYWDYSSLLQENITLLATTIIFIVLILTAMQVGLATEQLNNNKRFMAASYGFTTFAILFPFCALGLVAIRAVWQIVKDLPILLDDRRGSLETPRNNILPV